MGRDIVQDHLDLWGYNDSALQLERTCTSLMAEEKEGEPTLCGQLRLLGGEQEGAGEEVGSICH